MMSMVTKEVLHDFISSSSVAFSVILSLLLRASVCLLAAFQLDLCVCDLQHFSFIAALFSSVILDLYALILSAADFAFFLLFSGI